MRVPERVRRGRVEESACTYIGPGHDVDHRFGHLLQDGMVPHVLGDLEIQGVLHHRWTHESV